MASENAGMTASTCFPMERLASYDTAQLTQDMTKFLEFVLALDIRSIRTNLKENAFNGHGFAIKKYLHLTRFYRTIYNDTQYVFPSIVFSPESFRYTSLFLLNIASAAIYACFGETLILDDYDQTHISEQLKSNREENQFNLLSNLNQAVLECFTPLENGDYPSIVTDFYVETTTQVSTAMIHQLFYNLVEKAQPLDGIEVHKVVRSLIQEMFKPLLKLSLQKGERRLAQLLDIVEDNLNKYQYITQIILAFSDRYPFDEFIDQMFKFLQESYNLVKATDQFRELEIYSTGSSQSQITPSFHRESLKRYDIDTESTQNKRQKRAESTDGKAKRIELVSYPRSLSEIHPNTTHKSLGGIMTKYDDIDAFLKKVTSIDSKNSRTERVSTPAETQTTQPDLISSIFDRNARNTYWHSTTPTSEFVTENRLPCDQPMTNFNYKLIKSKSQIFNPKTDSPGSSTTKSSQTNANNVNLSDTQNYEDVVTTASNSTNEIPMPYNIPIPSGLNIDEVTWKKFNTTVYNSFKKRQTSTISDSLILLFQKSLYKHSKLNWNQLFQNPNEYTHVIEESVKMMLWFKTYYDRHYTRVNDLSGSNSSTEPISNSVPPPQSTLPKKNISSIKPNKEPVEYILISDDEDSPEETLSTISQISLSEFNRHNSELNLDTDNRVPTSSQLPNAKNPLPALQPKPINPPALKSMLAPKSHKPVISDKTAGHRILVNQTKTSAQVPSVSVCAASLVLATANKYQIKDTRDKFFLSYINACCKELVDYMVPTQINVFLKNKALNFSYFQVHHLSNNNIFKSILLNKTTISNVTISGDLILVAKTIQLCLTTHALSKTSLSNRPRVLKIFNLFNYDRSKLSPLATRPGGSMPVSLSEVLSKVTDIISIKDDSLDLSVEFQNEHPTNGLFRTLDIPPTEKRQTSMNIATSALEIQVSPLLFQKWDNDKHIPKE